MPRAPSKNRVSNSAGIYYFSPRREIRFQLSIRRWEPRRRGGGGGEFCNKFLSNCIVEFVIKVHTFSSQLNLKNDWRFEILLHYFLIEFWGLESGKFVIKEYWLFTLLWKIKIINVLFVFKFNFRAFGEGGFCNKKLLTV